MVKLPDKLNSIPRSKLLALFLLVIILLSLALGGIYLGLRFRKTPSPVDKEYITVGNLNTYTSPDEETWRSYIIPGRTFKIVEEKSGWVKISVWEKNMNMSWEGWIKKGDTNYQLKK